MGALSLTRRNTREVRATFYSRLRQYGSHGPGQLARFARPGQLARFHHDPSISHSGVRSGGDSIYDEFLTGELFSPSRTANQYLARYSTTPTYTTGQDSPARGPSWSAFWLQKPSILRVCVREEDAGEREAGAQSTTPTYTAGKDSPAREPSRSAFWLQKPGTRW